MQYDALAPVMQKVSDVYGYAGATAAASTGVAGDQAGTAAVGAAAGVAAAAKAG